MNLRKPTKKVKHFTGECLLSPTNLATKWEVVVWSLEQTKDLIV